MDFFDSVASYPSLFNPMKWLTRESFSERRFPGWWPWVKQICLYAWIAGFLHELLESRLAPKLFDTFTILVLWPLLSILLVGIGAYGCARLWRVSFSAALEGLLPYAPGIVAVPFLGAFIQAAGGVFELGFASGWQALASFLSGGVLPFSVAPSALVCLWVAALAWIIYSWLRIHSPDWQHIVLSLVPAYLGFPLIFLVPSFLGWRLMWGEVLIWSASADTVKRAFAATHIDGYTWYNVYERFPLAIGGEAHLSQIWLLVSLIYIAIVIASTIYLSRTWRWKASDWGRFTEKSSVARVCIPVVIGMVSALSLEGGRMPSFSHLIAYTLLIITSALSVLARMAKVDLEQALRGSLPGHRPLAMGRIRSTDVEEWGRIWSALSWVGAFLLGWPILTAWIWAEWIQHGVPDGKGWKTSLRHVLPTLGYVLAGWMVVVERGSFGALSPAMSALVCLAYMGWHWYKMRQDSALISS